MESIDFDEAEASKEGQELQPADTEELAEKEREKTGPTTATPTELAGSGTDKPNTHDSGPAEL